MANAAVASGISASKWAEPFDTVSFCFSKGLGAPVGSILAGPRDLIRLARRHRKLFGGGMRQAGVIAAGALYALQYQYDRLAEDHEHARIIAESIRNCPQLTLCPETVDTNIIVFRIDASVATGAQFVAALRQAGVAMLAFGADLVRCVTHLDVSHNNAHTAAAIILQVVEGLVNQTIELPEGGAVVLTVRPSRQLNSAGLEVIGRRHR